MTDFLVGFSSALSLALLVGMIGCIIRDNDFNRRLKILEHEESEQQEENSANLSR